MATKRRRRGAAGDPVPSQPWECGRKVVAVWHGLATVVFDPTDMRDVYDYGCYGKGSHSRGRPEVPPLAARRADAPAAGPPGAAGRPAGEEEEEEDELPAAAAVAAAAAAAAAAPVSSAAANRRADRDAAGFHRRKGPGTSTWRVAGADQFVLPGYATSPGAPAHSRAWLLPMGAWEESAAHERMPLPLVSAAEAAAVAPRREVHTRAGASREWLQLTLEESFHLLADVGSLRVVRPLADAARPYAALRPAECFAEFSGVRGDFARHYAAYRRYRRAGWTPRSGIKYGASFVLYRKGPGFFHAEWAVRVMPPEAYAEMHMCAFLNLNRVCEHVGKGVLYCVVSLPEGPLAEATEARGGDVDQEDARDAELMRWLDLAEFHEFTFERFIPERVL